MAKSKKEQEMVDGPQDAPVNTGPPASDYVVIVNLTGQPRDFMLLNARSEHCGPKIRGKEMNRSKAVLRKWISPQIYTLRAQGVIALEPPRESEVPK